MRDHLIDLFETEINPFYAALTPEELKQRDGKDAGDQPWSIPLFLYMSYWFASLNTVIEGWRLLKLCDDDVDRLLEKPRVARLKQYRDAVMHFRPQYIEKRVHGVFAEVLEFAKWAHALHNAFSSYFLRQFAQGSETDTT